MPGASDFRALGTGVRVLTTDPSRLQPAVGAVQRELTAADLAYSRFREDSELAQAVAAAGAWFSISPLLAEAISAALRAARMTDGLVDPTVGIALRVLGYDRDFAALPGDGPLGAEPIRIAGWQVIDFDSAGRRVRIPEGVELDLGATGKALAVDRAAHAAGSAAGCGVLVSVGGDIAAAGTPPAGGWPVLVTEDHAAPVDGPGDRLALSRGALATSTFTLRRWQRGGVMQHHIVDPRTGRPAEGPWRTASVIAGTCVDANTAATAALILGTEAPSWLEERRLPARLVDRHGALHRLSGWPAQDVVPV
jgi:thiamine biosynthesis lipoprotein